ncbi:hypothetical protein B566_EDAN016456 [Ephemera danica]|nr:hypothetical protein B566_EDAN016456 [Ephemera danica]
MSEPQNIVYLPLCIGDINARLQYHNKHLTTCVQHVSQVSCTCATPQPADSPVIENKGNPGVAMPDTDALKKLIEDLLSAQNDIISEQNKTLQDLQNKVNHQDLLITDINSNLKKLLSLTSSPQTNNGISQPTPTTAVQQVATQTPPTTRASTAHQDTQPRQNRKVLLPTPPPIPSLLSLPLQPPPKLPAPSIAGKEKLNLNEKFGCNNMPPSDNDLKQQQQNIKTQVKNIGTIPKQLQQPVKPTSKQSRLKFTEVEGDLFQCPPTTSLAHCVGRDLKMSAGIAADFKLIFGDAEKIKKENKDVGNTSFMKTNKARTAYEQRKIQFDLLPEIQSKTPITSYNIDYDEDFPPMSPIPINLRLQYRPTTPRSQSSWTPVNSQVSKEQADTPKRPTNTTPSNNSSWTPKTKPATDPLVQGVLNDTPKSHDKNSVVTPTEIIQTTPTSVTENRNIINDNVSENKNKYITVSEDHVSPALSINTDKSNAITSVPLYSEYKSPSPTNHTDPSLTHNNNNQPHHNGSPFHIPPMNPQPLYLHKSQPFPHYENFLSATGRCPELDELGASVGSNLGGCLISCFFGLFPRP